MFQKVIKKVKEIFAPIFKNTEKGAVVSSSLVMWGIWIAASSAIVYFSFKTGWWGNPLTWGIEKVMALLFFVSQTLFGISSNLFTSIADSAFLKQPITSGSGAMASIVIHGWKIVRDFANMFIVLGFVVVGIATILRIRTYEAQKTLLPLILVALLINFSLLICGIMIDATNITINYFTTISGPGGITQPYANIILSSDSQAKIQTAVGSADKDLKGYITSMTSISIFAGISAMIFFIYGILFLFRYVALSCLVILSPLAFVCSVFPATKSIFNKWREQFFQWAIIGIPAAFFIYLAGHLLQYLTSGANVMSDSLTFWIPTAFLLFAYTLIFQSSAIGASAAIGLATGAVSFVGGKIKSGGGMALKGLGNKTGITDKAKTIGGNALERIGLRAKGTTAQNAQKQMEERKKKMGVQTEEQQIASAMGRAFTPEQIRNKVASTENLVKDKKLHKIGTLDEQNKAITLAESQGYNTTIREDAEKLNPGLAKYNKPKIAEYMKPVAQGGRGLNQAQAELEYMTESVRKTAPAKVAEWDSKIITPEVFGSLGKNQLIEIGKRGSADSVEQIKKFKRQFNQNGQLLPLAQQSQEFQNLCNHIQQNYGQNSPEWNRAAGLLNELDTNNIFN